MVGLQFLFLEPYVPLIPQSWIELNDSNPDDPLNKGLSPWINEVDRRNWCLDAANDLAKNRDAFIQNVKTSMRGGSVRGETFDKVLI